MEANPQNTSLANLRYISREDTDREIANNVSTELTDFIDPNLSKLMRQLRERDEGMLAKSKNISREDRNIEIANNVSTELTVSVDDIWNYKKVLTMSDIGHLSRFLIPSKSVYELILKYLTEEEIKKVEAIDHKGLNINVFDSDTRTTHVLCFKRWKSSKSYILNENWMDDFVNRRNLKLGSEIGLFWNPYASRLHFSVFK